ncbi:hypothetical protein MRB53_014547 [Persea americana]|uniref:Uncharacterized protein n=1 Tax=Persea americana TaxID=3435 RepID=A0ACC2KBB9_PERAE|nr:hypothetical protein MRB53_014547 [Persea americana]
MVLEFPGEGFDDFLSEFVKGEEEEEEEGVEEDRVSSLPFENGEEDANIRATGDQFQFGAGVVRSEAPGEEI